MMRFSSFLSLAFLVLGLGTSALAQSRTVGQLSDLPSFEHFENPRSPSARPQSPTSEGARLNVEHILMLKKFNHFVKQGVPPEALRRALEFFLQTYGQTMRVKADLNETSTVSVRNDRYLGIADYTQASTARRFYLLDLKTGLVEKHYVAHGASSGFNWAQAFSNEIDSRKSSLGLYLTGDIYESRAFKSPAMKVYGLEATNSNAFARDIVIHQADYASPRFIMNLKQKFEDTKDSKYTPRLGRSWGCFAFDPKVAQKIIQKLKGGALIYSYVKGAEKQILESSQYQDVIRVNPALDVGEDTEEELLQRVIEPKKE